MKLRVLGFIPILAGAALFTISCSHKNNNPTTPGVPTDTPTITSTPTMTLSPTITSSPTKTGTPTQTLSPTTTATATPTPSITKTPTITLTPTVTLSPTITLTPTITSTPTITATITPTGSVTSTPTTTSTPSNDLVTDMVTVGGTWQNVFVLNADGSNLRKVTPYTILSIVQPCYTRWSPDKSKILFMNCSATDNDRLYVVNTDGTNLTALNAVGIMPAWSPDGTKIGYCIGGNTIAVIPATGGSPVTLVNGNGYYFAWSTDSTKILFTPVSPSSLCTVKADGSSSSPTTLVTSVGDYSYPTYSPDGTKIAVIYATNASGLGNLLVMNSDGTSPVSIAQAAVVDPVEWSPDGTKIAFAGYVSSNEVLYDISSSGTNLVQLSPSGYESDWPHWSPDSQSLVYVEAALNGIYTVKADGTQTTNVYDPYGGDNDSNTEWAPTH